MKQTIFGTSKRATILISLGLMIMLFGIAFASAESIGTFKQRTTVTLPQLCATCTSNNITNIQYPNGTIIVSNIQMTKTGSWFNYTLASSYITEIGTYSVNGIGDLDGVDTVWAYTFDVTGTGIQFTTANSLFYIALLCFLIFLFILNIVGISKLPQGNVRADSGNILSISLLKYFKPALVVIAWGLIISILFISSSISSAYLGSNGFSSFLFGFYKISSFLVYPMLLLGFAWMILMIFNDIKIKQLLDRGLSTQ